MRSGVYGGVAIIIDITHTNILIDNKVESYCEKYCAVVSIGLFYFSIVRNSCIIIIFKVANRYACYIVNIIADGLDG